MRRRSSRRKTTTKSYTEPSINDIPGVDEKPSKKDDDSDEEDEEHEEPKKIYMESDDDESDIEVVTPKKPRKKRGRPKGSGGSSIKKSTKKAKKDETPGSGKKSRDYGPLSERTCPFCKKVFSIVTGLAYHIEHNVCRKAKHRVSKDVFSVKPFPILEQGEKFVTPFGIVEVLKDDRVGEDFASSKFPDDIKERKKRYSRKVELAGRRRAKVHLLVAKKSRQRRNNLLQHYLNYREDADAENEFAKKVFNEYYPHASAEQIFNGIYMKSMEPELVSVEDPRDIDPDDPGVLVDSYPNRIVECVLIPDERKHVYDIDEEIIGRLSKVDVALALVDKAQKNVKKRKKKNPNVELPGSRIKLFLKRHSLNEIYNAGLPVYVCQKCGKNFTSRPGFRAHLDQKSCVVEAENFKIKRESRLAEVDEAIGIDLKTPPWLLAPVKTPPGEKKRKRSKRGKLPGWIMFHPELSTVYPGVFKHLKFKRGSNNSKFMKKKWDDIGPGRKKFRKSRAKKNSPLSVVNQMNNWMDISNQPMYPSVLAMLFPETLKRNPSSRAASKKAKEKVSRSLGDAIEDAAMKEEDEYNPDEDFDQNNGDDFLPSEHCIDVNAQMPPLPMPPLPMSPGNLESTKIPPLPALPGTKESAMITDPDILTDISQKAKKAESQVVTCATANANADATSTSVCEVIEKSVEDGKEGKVAVKPPKKRRRKRKSDASPPATKPSTPVIVDIRPLVEEVRAGRYPSMKLFTGEHLNICFHCKTQGDDVFNCEFCANSEHLGCVKSKVAIRDLEPDDEFMCHRCIQTILARRTRAERRRLDKLNDAKKAAASATGVSLEQTKNAATLKREVIWSQSEFDAHVSSYTKCPTGGPGGLICCGPCTAAYSKLLSETAKEMEVQTLSGVGREVSELLELLHDAQVRLKQAVDVSTGNDVRRDLLIRDEVGANGSNEGSNRVGNANLMGIMDIFSGK